MYFQLSNHLALRGWKGAPFAVANLKDGRIEFLTKQQFHVLSLCDGTIDLDFVVFTTEQRKMLSRFTQMGIVSPATEKSAIATIQQYRLSPNYFINGIHWSITGRCNLKCKHCYINAPNYKYHDLDMKNCRSLIAQMRAANVTYVTLTGGEPLLRSDFFELLDCLIENGIAIRQIYTNGLLADERFLQKLSDRKISPSFVLSYDGVGCHDWMRGLAGTEERTQAAIKQIISAGHDVMVETAIHRGNLESLPATYLLLAEYGVSKWKTSLVYETNRWKESDCITDVSLHELYEKYLQLIVMNRETGFPMAIQLDGFFSCSKGSGKYTMPYEHFDGTDHCLQENSCSTCRSHPYLLPNGELIPCASMTEQFSCETSNLTKTDLTAVYSDMQSDFFRLANMKVGEIIANNKECQNCIYKYKCGGGCRAMAFFSHTGLYGKSLTNCYFFFNHYQERIQQAMGLSLNEN